MLAETVAVIRTTFSGDVGESLFLFFGAEGVLDRVGVVASHVGSAAVRLRSFEAVSISDSSFSSPQTGALELTGVTSASINSSLIAGDDGPGLVCSGASTHTTGSVVCAANYAPMECADCGLSGQYVTCVTAATGALVPW